MSSNQQDFLEELGRQVQSRRLLLGWLTREQFSDVLSFSYRVVSDLENGKRKLGRPAYREVETVLGWEIGSVDNILAGGAPSLVIEVPKIQARATVNDPVVEVTPLGSPILAVEPEQRDAYLAAARRSGPHEGDMVDGFLADLIMLRQTIDRIRGRLDAAATTAPGLRASTQAADKALKAAYSDVTNSVVEMMPHLLNHYRSTHSGSDVPSNVGPTD